MFFCFLIFLPYPQQTQLLLFPDKVIQHIRLISNVIIIITEMMKRLAFNILYLFFPSIFSQWQIYCQIAVKKWNFSIILMAWGSKRIKLREKRWYSTKNCWIFRHKIKRSLIIKYVENGGGLVGNRDLATAY